MSLRGGRSLAEEVDPLTVASFALPPDALPPLRYVEAEKPSAAPAVGWDMAGYRLVPLSPTASQVAAEEAKMGEMGELGPQEPKVRAPPFQPALPTPTRFIPAHVSAPSHMSACAPMRPAGIRSAPARNCSESAAACWQLAGGVGHWACGNAPFQTPDVNLQCFLAVNPGDPGLAGAAAAAALAALAAPALAALAAPAVAILHSTKTLSATFVDIAWYCAHAQSSEQAQCQPYAECCILLLQPQNGVVCAME